ncbi:MAG: hypothetical protein EBR07_11035, partial [Planctomycetes bacterium]|nr:hypothetical protein [Planctomycetota bacterium]
MEHWYASGTAVDAVIALTVLELLAQLNNVGTQDSMPAAESALATDFLSLFINSSQVIAVGNAEYASRM